MQNNFTSKILYSDPDVGARCPIRGLVWMQVHLLANRWNSSFPLNFNVKGMLQASGSVGSWCWEGARVTVYACMCVCVSVYVCVSLEERGEINLSIGIYHLLCLTHLFFHFSVRRVTVTGSAC